jgi:hypothetical protein
LQMLRGDPGVGKAGGKAIFMPINSGVNRRRTVADSVL